MAKKTSQNLIVGFVLDESGSMSSCLEATLSGFNEFVDDLRSQPGETRLSLTVFSDRGHGGTNGPATFRPICADERIAKVPSLNHTNYRPNGNTPLFDAIGHTITTLEQRIGDTKDPVQFVIQTDGHENASREYTRSQIVDLIRRKEADGWKFIYLGANQDDLEAERAAGAMGMSYGSSMSYDYAETKSAYGGVAVAAASLRANPDMTSAQVTNTARAETQKREQAKASQPPIPRPKEDRGKPQRKVTPSDKPNF